MRRLKFGLVFIFILLLVGRGSAFARAIRQGDQCIIEANETVEGNLFALCRTLQIRGTINGDVLGAATEAKISGKITGDIYMLAGQLEITGDVGEDVHFAGSVLHILSAAKLSNPEADLMSLSLSTTIDPGASVPGNVTAAGYQLVLNGPVGRELSFWGSALVVNNTLGGDVDAQVGDPQSTGVSQLQTLIVPFGWDVQLINPGLTIGEKGTVGGHLNYTASVPATITGVVSGETTFTKAASQSDLTQIIQPENRGALRLVATEAIHEFVVLALIGIAALLFVPRPFQVPLRALQSRTLPSAGVGLLAFIVSFPITIVVLVLIILLLIVPLVVLQLDGLFVVVFSGSVLGAWGGAASVFYFMAIFISRAVVALFIGRIIVRAAIGDDGSQRVAFISLLVGIFLLSIVVSLPVVGIIVSAVTAFMGLGAILIVLNNQLRSLRETVPAPALRTSYSTAVRRSDARSLPPPLIDDQGTPGMNNLPAGFEWWDD